MPKVGEAFYELTARDAGLFKTMGTAEGRIRQSGTNAEKEFGGSVVKGVTAAENAVAGGTQRMGGMFGTLGGHSERLRGTFDNLKTGLVQGLGIGGFMAVSTAASMFIGKITDSVGLASDLNETVAKSQATFGSAAQGIMQWSTTASTSFGLSQKAALDFAATFGGLLMNFGQTPPAAAEMSQSLVELAADMASFSNSSIEDALAAIQSGLVGEQEPLRRFQVNLNEARIQQRALELGLWDGKGALDASAKSSAIYSLIMTDTSRQQGDFARTATGLANQQRTAAALNEEAWTRFGAALLPIANVVIPALAAAGRGLIDFLAMLLTHGRELVPVLVVGFGILAALTWSTVVPAFVAWAAATIAATWPLIAIGAAVAGVVVILDKLGLLGPIIDAFWNLLGAGAQIVGAAFDAVQTVIRGFVSVLIGIVRNVVGIAAQIPGPWQQAAKEMQATLQGMQDDVDAWGKKTSAKAAGGADDIVSGVADALEDGKPAVAAGADTGLTKPVVGGMNAAKKEAVAVARATPGEIGRALAEGRDSAKSGGDALRTAFEDAIKPTKEIARLEGDLTGKLMRKGLASNDPIVRAAAEQWKKDIEERLFVLRNNVGGTALKTGQNYADALASKRKAVEAGAEAAMQGARGPMQLSSAEKWGIHAGREWADGLASQAYYAAKAAREFASGARGALEFTVPKEGPLVGMNTWGKHAGQSWAEGFESQADYLKDSVAKYAQGGFSQTPGFGAPPQVPEIDVARAIAPISNSNSTVTQVTIGDVNVPVTFAGNAPATSAGIRDLGRALGEEVRLTLLRTPDFFPVRGG